MLAPFFALAMLAPNRQRSFRRAVVLHVLFAAVLAVALARNAGALPVVGQLKRTRIGRFVDTAFRRAS